MGAQGEDRFQTMANTLAKLGKRLDSSLRLLNAISSLTAMPVKATRLGQAAQEMLEILVRELTGIQSCSILLHDENLHELRLLAARGQGDLLGEEDGPYNRELSFKPGEGVAGKVFLSGSPVFWSNSSQDESPLKKDPSLLTDPPALACLPLSSLGRSLGVLNISFSDPTNLGQAKRREFILLAGITANILNSFLQKAELDQFAAILAGRAVRSEQQYQRLFDSALLGIMRFSPLGELINVNPACARLFGYDSPQEMVGLLAKKQTNLFVEPHQRKRIVELVQKARGTLVLENRYLKRDGEPFGAVLHARAVRDAQGNLLGLEGFIQKSGDAKGTPLLSGRMEEELIRAQRMQAVGVLTCGIAHDFNNVLTAVVGFTQMAHEQIAPGEQARESLDNALKACDRAKDLLSQLLAFTRGQKAELKPLELAPVIEDSLTFLRAIIPDHIDIELKSHQRPLCAMADAGQLSQVILNICNNASQAMEGEGGILRVELDELAIEPGPESAFPELEPGDYLCISFSDQGPGVAPEIIERIFEPFFTTKSHDQGTGMGLTVSLDIIRNLGGTMRVESPTEGGAIFKIYLPRLEGPWASPDRQEPDTMPGGKENILFVDDQAELAQIAARLLSSLGYQVTTLNDSEAALSLVKEDPKRFDLLVTDQIMPRMSGDRLGREVKRLRPDLPMVLCTGLLAGASEQLIKDSGFSRIAYKPLRAKDLARLVREVLDGAA